ncbi:MAG TPA: FAD-dependent oxidoreductase [Gemmatimonadaceae bacterium]
MSKVVVVGGGFAGVWAALAASAQGRRHARQLDITVVSRDPWLTIRPRLYENDISGTRVPLDDVLGPAGVERVESEVRRLNWRAHEIVLGDGTALRYDRLVLAPGSVVQRAAIPGAAHAFAVDTWREAMTLQDHLDALRPRPNDTSGRATAVVIGAGFTGIEVATSLASRMRRVGAAAGARQFARVVLLERAPAIAPDLGDDARRHVQEALATLRVEVRSGTEVAAIESDGVRLGSGEWIPSATVILTGGFRANPLMTHITEERDPLGRVSVDAYLRVRDVEHVYAAGDVARAAADAAGHIAPMSCQCAIPMGEIAGANAAAELLGGKLAPFSHSAYVTCLDLGDAGALFMEGWDREVRLTGFWAKVMKETINTRLIYPPRPGYDSRPANVVRPAA